MINGFFENLFATRLSPSRIADFPSLYSSRTVIENGTLRIEMEADDNVARSSPCLVGKANIMKGIPKKAVLPKIVLKINR